MTSQILNRTRTQEQEEDLVPDGAKGDGLRVITLRDHGPEARVVSAPAGNPLQELFEEIDALNRKRIYKQVPNEPAEAGPNAAPA
jgi:hypothetical protein